MSIAPPTGAMSPISPGSSRAAPIFRCATSPSSWRSGCRASSTTRPSGPRNTARLLHRGTLFEELGFYYVGPTTATTSTTCCRCSRTCATCRAPCWCMSSPRRARLSAGRSRRHKYHGVSAFDVATGARRSRKSNAPSYTSVFADAMVAEGARDEKIVAVTAAMPQGPASTASATPIRPHLRRRHRRAARRHFRRGLATEGFKPFCAIYSTFLQRAYDKLCTTSRCRTAGALRHRSRRAGRRRRPDPRRRFDIAYLACLPT